MPLPLALASLLPLLLRRLLGSQHLESLIRRRLSLDDIALWADAEMALGSTGGELGKDCLGDDSSEANGEVGDSCIVLINDDGGWRNVGVGRGWPLRQTRMEKRKEAEQGCSGVDRL